MEEIYSYIICYVMISRGILISYIQYARGAGEKSNGRGPRSGIQIGRQSTRVDIEMQTHARTHTNKHTCTIHMYASNAFCLHIHSNQELLENSARVVCAASSFEETEQSIWTLPPPETSRACTTFVQHFGEVEVGEMIASSKTADVAAIIQAGNA